MSATWETWTICAGRCSNRQILQGLDSVDCLRLDQDANLDDAIPFQDRRGRLAQHGGIDRLGDLIDRQTETFRVHGPDLQVDRVARVDQPIEGIDNPLDLLDALFELAEPSS